MYHSSYAQWSSHRGPEERGYEKAVGSTLQQSGATHSSPPRPRSSERDDRGQQDATYAAKLRAIQQLSLSGNPSSSYNDTLCGPLRPGFEFYKLLSLSPTLNLKIPDTLYVKKSRIYSIKTNEKGVVIKSHPDYHSDDGRTQFVNTFLTHLVQESRSPAPRKRSKIESNDSNFDIGDSMISRIVAVQKRPQWSEFIRNTTQIHTTLSLQAVLQNIFEGEDEEMVLQAYVKPKGRTANFFRYAHTLLCTNW